MCAWHNDRRSRSRTRARGRPTSGVEYVSASYAPNPHSHYSSSSSDCSSLDDYRRPHSIRISAGHGPRRRDGMPPRAPTVPGSPTTPSLDFTSDSPSSTTSSRFYDYASTLSPHSEPEIVDHHGYAPYTGAYSYGNYAANERFAPGPPVNPAPKRKPKLPPVVPAPMPPEVPVEPNLVIAEPDEGSLPSPTMRRGGPKARSYLSADAQPPDPIVVEVKDADSPPLAGPTQAAARTVMPVYPQSAPPQQHASYYHHRHPVHPAPSVPSDPNWGDDEEYNEVMYVRRRERPRNGIRHIPIDREPPRQRSRSRPTVRRHIEIPIEREESPPRRRHRSRSRHRNHHHHHHRHRSRSRPPNEEDKEEEKRAAALRAQIDALTTRLNNIMDDPYARDVIAAEGMKFDDLKIPKEAGGTAAI